MQQLIPLINEIHDILNKSQLAHDLKLPQVVVVGSQSTGKSSVLESIIGKQFLPRGKGIVTRRPIEIQLSLIKHEEGGRDWCEFFDKKGEIIYDFEEVKNRIQEETNKICGENKGVSKNPIRLKIFSDKVVDLLLVDLPGMTKNPVGDQPEDIEKQVVSLITPYVENPNSIILAISKANDDLANSESLKLARHFDPHGVRTLGVITQLDLMEQGTDAVQDLLGQTYHLKLGYIGVVMRGQRDIQSKSIEDQLQAEQKFFENSQYQKVAGKMGIPYLIKTLNLQFINHIKECLPYIKSNIIRFIQKNEQDLKKYGEFDEFEDNKQRGFFILSMISKFSTTYKDLVEGKHLQSDHGELFGGSRINYIFSEIFRKSLNSTDPFEHLKDEEIRTAIRNANGLRPSLFVPEIAFENLVKQQISRLFQPSLQCSKIVYEEQRKILNMIEIPEIERFDSFSSRIRDVMEALLKKLLQPTEQMIKNLIEIEMGYINTSHPDFCGGIGLLQNSNDLLGKQDQKQEIQSDVDKRQSQQQQQQGLTQSRPANIAGNESQDEQYIKKPQYDQNGQETGFWSWLPFTKNPNNQDVLDGKLKSLKLNKKISNEIPPEKQLYPELMYTRAYNEDFSMNSLGQNIPKSNLPSVPSTIKLAESFSKKEQTETRMIKNLIVSYYNVVKKNINDSVPKTIITFLTNNSVNICERELVSSLYQEDKFETLLAENEFIVKQRQETKKNLNLLKQCLNILIDTEQKI